MRLTLLTFAFLFAAASASAETIDPEYLAIMAKDAPKAADTPLTGRYQGSNLLGQTVKAFDELSLPAGPAEGHTYASDKHFSKLETVQGKVTRTLYVAPAGRSSLEVFTNYRDALAAQGFEPVYECAREACGESFNVLKYNWQNKASQVIAEGYEQVRQLIVQAAFDAVLDPRYALMKRQNQDGVTWAAVYAALNKGGSMGTYSTMLSDRVSTLVELVEPRAMEHRMETIPADKIASDLAADGHAVFHNILFDFDKADIKPESQPQVAEMAQLLKSAPSLKVYIVGHTDAKGGLDYNIRLSGKRAAAVATMLTKTYGIASARLVTRGLGPLAPVATNRTDEGREKNRRVELVEQ